MPRTLSWCIKWSILLVRDFRMHENLRKTSRNVLFVSFPASYLFHGQNVLFCTQIFWSCKVMLCFICLLGPFAFFDVSKTKLLQLFTSALRWTSFISMIVLSIIRIAGGHHVTPVGANFAQIPNLFGVAVYSFMCQHSLPGNGFLKKFQKKIFKKFL